MYHSSRASGAVTPEKADLLLSTEHLRGRRNMKWSMYPGDVIPAYVADMDYRIAPVVQQAIMESVESEDYGYPLRNGKRAEMAVAEAFARRMHTVFDWETDPSQVLVLADLIQATCGVIMAFSEPGDGVIVQTPNYPPFRDTIASTNRKMIPWQMELKNGRFSCDIEALEALVDLRSRILVLCNPQNPTGRVYTRSELLEFLAFAEKHDLLVLSDEIHSDLVYRGHRHIPFASLNAAAAARTITITSATKSFGIPGLRTAVAHFGTPALMARFNARIPLRLLCSVNSLGIDATVAAWTQGQPWLDGVITHLEQMRDHLAEILERELPMVKFTPPEATYLGWIDCSGLSIEGSAQNFFLKEAGIAFSAGEAFQPGAENFVRINFATSQSMLDEIVTRMKCALTRNTR